MKRKMRLFKPVATALFLIVFAWSVFAQNGYLVRESLHSVLLENTITKELPDRNISIYLPPSCKTSVNKKYPVIYHLHGIGDTDETWTKGWDKSNPGFSSIQDVMDKGIADGKFGEMIVVMPDEKTNWFGSFYVNSAVTGKWEDFTSKDLVDYVDSNYRTISNSKSRGISGHSMGGFGALNLAMKHPEVFSVAYGLNPAVMEFGGDLTIASPAFEFVLNAKSYEELLKTNDIYHIGTITVAQAFSPNESNPPFYADFPFKKLNGKMVPNEPAFSKWRENSTIRMVVKYRESLHKLRGIRFDSGYEDEFKFIPVNSRLLSNELTNNGIEHIFEEYNGDHRNRLWGLKGRIYNNILPYFWDLLDH